MGAGALERGQHTARAAVVPTRRVRRRTSIGTRSGSVCRRERSTRSYAVRGWPSARSSLETTARKTSAGGQRVAQGVVRRVHAQPELLGHRLDVRLEPGPRPGQSGRPEQGRGVDHRGIEAAPPAPQGTRQERPLDPGGMGDQHAVVELGGDPVDDLAQLGGGVEVLVAETVHPDGVRADPPPGSDVGVDRGLAGTADPP